MQINISIVLTPPYPVSCIRHCIYIYQTSDVIRCKAFGETNQGPKHSPSRRACAGAVLWSSLRQRMGQVNRSRRDTGDGGHGRHYRTFSHRWWSLTAWIRSAWAHLRPPPVLVPERLGKARDENGSNRFRYHLLPYSNSNRNTDSYFYSDIYTSQLKYILLN
jgi:hypothetical protein